MRRVRAIESQFVQSELQENILFAYEAMLLEKMGRQLYPYGIPAGSKGKVYDKVGFLWSYIHDTGIVYHPKGTYVLTVMTSGYSYAKIAEITRQVEAIMYP